MSDEEITPAEALEVFDDYERAVLASIEVRIDGAPAALRRACDRALGEDDEDPEGPMTPPDRPWPVA